MKKLLVAAILASYSMLGVAQERTFSDYFKDTWVVGTVGSHHQHKEDNNEKNRGLGIEHNLTQDTRLVLGQYRNSQYINSSYGGLQTCWYKLGYACLSTFAGYVSGYTGQHAQLYRLAVLPAIQVEYNGFGANLLVARTSENGTIVGLQLKAKVW